MFDRLKDLCRYMIDTSAQDVIRGLRMLRANLGFTIIAALSLGIGIGSNIATFGFVDMFWFRPLSVPRASEVLTIGSLNIASAQTQTRASYPDFADVRAATQTFDEIAATNVLMAQVYVPDRIAPQYRTAMVVSGNYFTAMDIQLALGRAFSSAEDEAPLRDPVIVLSHGYWTTELGADPAVLGLDVQVNGTLFEVIGVAPESFHGTDKFFRPDFYVPTMMWPALVPQGQPNPLEERALRSLTLKGRLADGVSIEQASSEIGQIGAALAADFPETNQGQVWLVQTELETRGVGFGFLSALLSLSAALFLVACANVAGLLASRAPARSDEIAMRLALGASRARIFRQLITENLLLALLGAVVGLGIGYLGIQFWQSVQILSDPPIAWVIEMDSRMVIATLSVAVVSVLLFGAIPALQTARRNQVAAIRNLGGGTARRSPWGRRALEVGQVALALLLVSVAGATYRSMMDVVEHGPGFRTDHLLMMSFDPGMSLYDLSRAQAFYRDAVERTRQLPGVESVALGSFVPMLGSAPESIQLAPEGYELPTGLSAIGTSTSFVDAGFLDTMGITLVAGRKFLATDSANAPKVAIVTEGFARRFWPGENAVGKFLRIGSTSGPRVETVGIVPTVSVYAAAEVPVESIYMPHAQNPRMQMSLFVETTGDAAALTSAVRRIIAELDPGLAAIKTVTMREAYDVSVANTLVNIRAIGAIGFMGVLLAFSGLYGLVASGVSQRIREFGIRMAIGATPRRVLRMALTEGVTLALVGVAIGLFLSLGGDSAALLAGATIPNSESSRLTFGEYFVVVCVVLVVMAIGSYIPARRAARIELATTLRESK